MEDSRIIDIYQTASKKKEETFKKNVGNLRRFEEEVASRADDCLFSDNHQKVIECVDKIVSGL